MRLRDQRLEEHRQVLILIAQLPVHLIEEQPLLHQSGSHLLLHLLVRGHEVGCCSGLEAALAVVVEARLVALELVFGELELSLFERDFALELFVKGLDFFF